MPEPGASLQPIFTRGWLLQKKPPIRQPSDDPGWAGGGHPAGERAVYVADAGLEPRFYADTNKTELRPLTGWRSREPEEAEVGENSSPSRLGD
jgi:hypothetical protein